MTSFCEECKTSTNWFRPHQLYRASHDKGIPEQSWILVGEEPTKKNVNDLTREAGRDHIGKMMSCRIGLASEIAYVSSSIGWLKMTLPKVHLHTSPTDQAINISHTNWYYTPENSV
jgi:hypothetical protein